MSNRLKSRLSYLYLVIAVAFVAAVSLVAHLGLQWPFAAVKAAEEKTAAVKKLGGFKELPLADGEASLPLKRVVLFSSGVGYFAHTGQVQRQRQSRVEIQGSRTSTICSRAWWCRTTAAGMSPPSATAPTTRLEKRLSSFAIDLNGNPRLAALLGQIRGERVEVDAPNKIVGTIVGLETRKQEVGKDHFIESDVLNLL